VSRREIVEVGHPVLRERARELTREELASDRVQSLIDDMIETMRTANGAGLAANQIGVSLQVFVYDCDDDAGRNHVGHVVNPVLVTADGETVDDDEGCLSLPGLRFPTPRYGHAVVEGVDMTGAPLRVEGTGYFARCLQHEMGHLKGRLYVDTLKGDARKAALRAVRAADWS
jgi:peptide deformylase